MCIRDSIDSVAKDDSVRAEVTLDNPEGVVPGISAELDIETYLNENCLTIPIEASKTDRTGDYCYVARDNGDGTYRPEKVYITTGNSSLTSVEVLEGLNEGDIAVSYTHLDVYKRQTMMVNGRVTSRTFMLASS